MKRTMRSMTQVVTSPVHGENSLMGLPPLPFHSPRGSSRSSYIDSEVDLVGFVVNFHLYSFIWKSLTFLVILSDKAKILEIIVFFLLVS